MIVDGFHLGMLIGNVIVFAIGCSALAFHAGIKKGCKISSSTVKRAHESFAKEHVVPLKLGEKILDLLERHHAVDLCSGDSVTVRHWMDWEHAGRTYRLTLTSAPESAS